MDIDNPKLEHCSVQIDYAGTAIARYQWEGNPTPGADRMDEDVTGWSDDEVRSLVADMVGIVGDDVARIEVHWECDLSRRVPSRVRPDRRCLQRRLVGVARVPRSAEEGLMKHFLITTTETAQVVYTVEAATEEEARAKLDRGDYEDHVVSDQHLDDVVSVKEME